ncbi:SMI1/KNR4 family protein [Chitinibacter sp. GC72]|uniref:SMI1/KNR4 family protein n=1 Tax=Chitinibacter sp. GC72 TaxID=1526917 RepID=UPI0012FAF307|nr:SMI1/KNR4 family protein [Chitinibacter sp. GC72]
MKILFPNPYGYELPSSDRVAAIQEKYQFSNDYSAFLRQQNGFVISSLEEAADSPEYMADSPEEEDGKPDFRVLYGLDSADKYYDLEEQQHAFIFKDLFFPIGVDYGGNDFVEILHGKFKGYIASLDHDLYASCDSQEEFIQEFELDNFAALSPSEKADLLADEEIGLAWLLAPSMSEFTAKSIHCNENFSGYVVDLVS